MARRLFLPLFSFMLAFPIGLRLFDAAADSPLAPLVDPADAERICHRTPQLIAHMPKSAGFQDVVSADTHRRRERFAALYASTTGAANADAAGSSASSASTHAGVSTALTTTAGIRVFAPLTLADARLIAMAPTALPTAVPTALPTALPDPTDPPIPTERPAPTTAPPDPTEPPADGPTYWRDAMPVLRRECVRCHTDEGIAPFALETYDQAAAVSEAVKWALSERIMPPLPPDPSRGLPLDDPRVMSDEDRATLIAWIDADVPEGDPADAPPPEPPDGELPPPSMSFDIGADYTPAEGLTDDYRCFDIDPGLTADTEITMVDLVQTNRRTFHHGIMFLALPGDVEDVRRLDRADPRPGYECFGGPGFASDEWIIAEAAAGIPRPFADGTAKVIPAGSHFVLQIHYNTLNGDGPDRTRVDVWTPDAPVGKRPVDLRLVNPLFRIPAGVDEHTVTADARIADGPLMQYRQAPPGRIHQVWGHMHYLGDEFALDLERADGTTQRLLDIPRWDFNWQGVYDLVTPIEVAPGDRIRMTCTWDNSPENQPLIGGVRQTPRPVTWGEGTLDEMCLGGVTIVPE